jgi:diaminohydroxyphosphoribosylaminopyrimidine deaminase / 5-amino-6-(5-phosphoribosylamino)uracil reductase
MKIPKAVRMEEQYSESDHEVTQTDREYMRQALELARRGLGQTYPNPAVGCILVKNGQVGRNVVRCTF